MTERAAPSGYGPVYRAYALTLLTAGYAISFVDRQALFILLESIKRDLHLTDTQLGLLSGPPFALFYATLGIPLGMLADRSNRRNLVAAAIAVFSSMTLVCGMATSYLQLVLGRIGVAVGEAGSNPPSYSMLSDLFPPQTRARAFSIYSLGINIGLLIGLTVGGWLNHLYGWHVALFAIGAPGLVLALLIRLTLREPARGAQDRQADAGQAPSFREGLAFVWSQRSMRYLVCGGACSSMAATAAQAWLPTHLVRTFGLPTSEIGLWLGLIVGLVGAAGTITVGVVASRLAKRDLRWNLWLVAILFALAFPCYATMFLAPTPALVWIAYLFPAFVLAAYVGPPLATIQGLVPMRMRGLASAILLLGMGLVGAGVGPVIPGALSDLLAPYFGDQALRYSLVFASLGWLASAGFLMLAVRTVRADVHRVEGLAPAAA